jgi:hypothetical protein
VIHSAETEGAINAIKWRGPFIAWANDVGVKIYDNDIGQRITYIDRPKNRFSFRFSGINRELVLEQICIVVNFVGKMILH